MYSTCIFCHSDLGKNEAIEHFPIGRRLAFDASRGRLWVVCRKCERWNLTPLDERWEAIEECERAFRATKLRVSTDNVGLARVRDATELVRIGSPQRPEMAAWRYGDQFGRRRTRHYIYTGAALAVGAGIILAGPATGIIAGSSWGLWNILSTTNTLYQQRRVRARLNLPISTLPVAIRLKQLNRVSLLYEMGRWALHIPYESPDSVAARRRVSGLWNRWAPGVELTTQVTGDAAIQAAAKLLPAINASGANRNEVTSAVQIIEDAAVPDVLFARYAAPDWTATRRRASANTPGSLLTKLPKEVRLALEMATHEDSERRALEGELSLLEDAWKEAEEIAGIADDMFVPESTREQLRELKRAAEEG
jgi:hypothetical protein